MRQILAKIAQGSFDRFSKQAFGAPAELIPNLRIVGIIIADIDGAPVGREITNLVTTGSVNVDHELRDCREIDDFASTEVIDLAVCQRTRRSQQKGIDCILDISEVTQLLSTPDRYRLAFE